MRAVLLLTVATSTLAVGAWATTARGALPACTPKDATSKTLVTRGRYAVACGPGSAHLTFRGVTYRIKGSRCFISPRGARLYFGAHPLTSAVPPPLTGLYLVVEPNRTGAVEVIDGWLSLASGQRASIFGKARATNGLKRGTFTLLGHIGDGNTDKRRFTGSWRC